MQKIINSVNTEKSYSKNDYNKKFLFIENVSLLKKVDSEIELCIIKTDFNKNDLKCIKKIIDSNKGTEIWISSNHLTRENVLNANKIGVNTVIPSTYDKKLVEEFFNTKSGFYIKKEEADLKYDYSIIANSKVMIVDDNLMNVELLEEILSKFGLEISSFLKPKEAYQVLLQEKFDLVLLDVMMPEMSGFELAKKIKNTPLNKDTPIIFISALSDSHNKIKGYNLGSYAYIEKPFDVNIIKSQIFNVLKTKKAHEVTAMSKENFLATITHDLKTPIRAGINALNLLLNENLGELKDDQHELVEDILNSTKYMQDMVENLLCKTKMENNSIELSKQVCSLRKLAEHCIELTKYILIPKRQQIQLKCELSNTLIPIDFLEMKRAIHNLIANASEYSPIEGKILIKIFQAENRIGLLVQDYGRGIDLEVQNDIFTEYMSLAKKNKTVGTGLGLYITKRIIEAHGGEISVTSKSGIGTTITIYLPTYDKI